MNYNNSEKNIYLFRHGENLNIEGLSNTLLPLSYNGITQSCLASKKLKNKFDILFSSPLQRTKMTSRIIMGSDKFKLDNRLLERHWGNNDGSASLQETELRVLKMLKAVLKNYKNSNILFVTHGGLIKTIQKVIEGKDYNDKTIDNATIIKYGANGKKEIKRILY